MSVASFAASTTRTSSPSSWTEDDDGGGKDSQPESIITVPNVFVLPELVRTVTFGTVNP